MKKLDFYRENNMIYCIEILDYMWLESFAFTKSPRKSRTKQNYTRGKEGKMISISSLRQVFVSVFLAILQRLSVVQNYAER